MRHRISGLSRFVATAGHSKRLSIAWCDDRTLASNATDVFAFDDDYSMGILFATFPWPDPVTTDQREAAAQLSIAVVERRQEICQRGNFGLTKLYNLMDDGAYADLKKLHKQLDKTVAACYGWPKSVAQNPQKIVRRLTALNKEITEGARPYRPFGDAED